MTDVGRFGGLGPDELELHIMVCRLGMSDMVQPVELGVRDE